MTPDVDAIRAALAAATPGLSVVASEARKLVAGNAFIWLDALCDEIERLRAENRTLRADMAGGEP